MAKYIPPHLNKPDPQKKLQADFEAMNPSVGRETPLEKTSEQAELEKIKRPVVNVFISTSNKLAGTATSRIASRRRQARLKNQAVNTVVVVVFAGIFLVGSLALLIAYATGEFLSEFDAPTGVKNGLAAFVTAEVVLYGTIGVVGLIGFGIWLYALVDLVGKPFDDGNQKLIWVLIVIFCGTVGAVIYLMMGDESSRYSSRGRRY